MELLFYILYGMLLGIWTVLGFTVCIVLMYGYFKFVFWVFEVLKIENPILTIVNWCMEQIDRRSMR